MAADCGPWAIEFERARLRAGDLDLDLQVVVRQALGHAFRPFNQRDARPLEILLHAQFQELVQIPNAIGIQVVERAACRDSGWHSTNVGLVTPPGRCRSPRQSPAPAASCRRPSVPISAIVAVSGRAAASARPSLRGVGLVPGLKHEVAA